MSAGQNRRDEGGSASSRYLRIGLTALILIAFAGLAYFTMSSGSEGSRGADGQSMTSVQNDTVADFEQAAASGRPVYVLFHSLNCDPCIEISAVADRVVPDYRGRVEFVNAITDSSSGRALASQFRFQYIPTSFFLSSGGEVVDSHTGTLTEEQMRTRLDGLVAG